jgi:DNA-binding transcriptional LysR family regulator
MSLNWDDLRITLAIAEHGTLSGAAVHLRISHPTLSRRLQLIERRLGTRLFERTPSSLRLTAAGEDMRQMALRLRDDIAALERRIGGRDTGPEGAIRLTAPDAVAEYLLPGVLAALCKEHPGLAVDLLVSNQVVSLAQRAADIALRVTDAPTESLRGRRVGTVAMAVYAARDLGVPQTSAFYAGIPWVGFDAALACSGPGAWVARNIADGDIRFRANTLLAAAQAVRSGIGCGVLPCFVGGSVVSAWRSRLDDGRRAQAVGWAGCQRCGSSSPMPCRLGGQPLEHIAQVRVGIVPVDPRRVHQAHDRGRTLARAQ